MSDLYQFTFNGTQVTGIQEYDDDVWKRESISDDEVWSYDVNTRTVSKSETEHGVTKTTTYTDENNDGVFIKQETTYENSQDSNFSNYVKQYEFTFDGAQVTSIIEHWRNETENEDIEDDEVWSYDPLTDIVTKTESDDGYVETSIFVRGINNLFVRESKSYSMGGSINSSIQDIGDDDLLYGGDEDDDINAGRGDDYIESQGGDDDISGGSGDDYIYSGAGDDVVNGDSGNDLIVGGDGAGNDIYRGGKGIDTVKYTSANAAIVVNLARGTASGVDIDSDQLSSIENVIAGAGDDILIGSVVTNYIYGGLGDDTLNGGKGFDYLYGGAGNDSYYVDHKFDKVFENADEGNDTVFAYKSYTLGANVENLTLLGKTGLTAVGNELDNIIRGNAGPNRIFGGAGNDIIAGGQGPDRLTGGTGADRFLFDSKLKSSNSDRITDFEDGTDFIQLDDAIFTQFTPDSNLNDFIAFGNKAMDANDYLLYDATTGKLIYDANADAKGGAVTIAFIGVGLNIDASDFEIV